MAEQPTPAEQTLMAALEAVDAELADALPLDRIRLHSYIQTTLREFRAVRDAHEDLAAAANPRPGEGGR